MDPNSTRKVALLSIHPRFAQLILDGCKKVEFRRTRFKEHISHVVIYATYPVKRIIGFFKVKQIDEATPKQLWTRYQELGGVDHEFFWSYYAATSQGVAIRIGKVFALDEPLPLAIINGLKSPPQNFRYLADEQFTRIKEGLNPPVQA